MELAIKEAQKSRGEDERTHPRVGVVIAKDGKILASAHRGEITPGDHAEFTALEKKLRDEIIAGATVYTTLEPCTTRNHPKIPCAMRLVERKVKRVVIGMLDPNPTISGEGQQQLREANIETDFFPADLMAQIEELNRDFIRFHKIPKPKAHSHDPQRLGIAPLPEVVLFTKDGLTVPLQGGITITGKDCEQFRDHRLSVKNNSNLLMKYIDLRLQLPEGVVHHEEESSPAGVVVKVLRADWGFSFVGSPGASMTSVDRYPAEVAISINELPPQSEARMLLRTVQTNLSRALLGIEASPAQGPAPTLVKRLQGLVGEHKPLSHYISGSVQFEWNSRLVKSDFLVPLGVDWERRVIRSEPIEVDDGSRQIFKRLSWAAAKPSMSGQRLIPTREQLTAIMESTRSFLDYLQDAVLVEGVKTPPVPQSTIPYKKSQAVHEWATWEQAMNPSGMAFEGPPFGMAAGGWNDWKALHSALVDLYALRKQLITHWGLAPIVGAKSVRFGCEAVGKPGSGEKALSIHAEKVPASGTAGHVHIEKPLDWPPPVLLEWWEQCRHALQRIKHVMEAQSGTLTQKPRPNLPLANVPSSTELLAEPSMHARIEGRFVDFSGHEYFGGMTERGTYEDLYRTPSGEWVLHIRPLATAKEPSLRTLSEDEAVGWLIELRQSRARPPGAARHERGSVPHWVVPREEYWRCGRSETTGPPPIGQQIDLSLPKGSVTADQIEERQNRLLEPGKVLEQLLWPPAADVAATAGFRAERHDPLVTRLQGILEAKLFERPRLAILQSLQDRGCDLLIEWPLRVKYGVQLKSNGDVEEEGFANKTLAQIQDSRQHGLERLFVVLAADITENSNAQKVRGLMSRISAMNDRYVVVVPPERAWSLLSPGAGAIGAT